LAQEIPAVRFGADDWMARLGVDLHDEEIRARLEGLFWELTQELLQLGTSAILEFGLWVRAELRYLDVPADELWRRLEQRNRERPFGSVPISHEQFERYCSLFQAPDRAELDLFDDPTVLSARA
jgi:hypothetical protein